MADLGGANAPPFGGTLKNDYAAMACSNNSQADPGVVRWVRSNPLLTKELTVWPYYTFKRLLAAVTSSCNAAMNGT